MKYILFNIILIIPVIAFSQNVIKSKIIKGKVTSVNGIPINYVSVFNIENKVGTETDKSGEYYLIIKHPSTITFSLLGFQSVEINITQSMLSDSLTDSLTFNIVLKTAIKELNTVEVTADDIKIFYDKTNATLLDYEFNNDNILLLISENKKTKLRLINADTDSIIKDKLLTFKAEEFFRDCFNNIQIISKDSIYQIYVLNSDIYVYKGQDIKQLNSLLSAIAITPKFLFLQQYGPHNQSVTYSYINIKSKERKTLTHITNEESEVFARGELKKIAQLKASGSIDEMGDLSGLELRILREIKNRTWFYQQILLIPAYNPLKKIRDSIFIFNHVTDTAYVYNADVELIRTFNIKYHYVKGWKNDIIIDDAKQSAFAKFINDGIVYLCKINLNDGNILNQYKLEQNTFPDKIKIRNNYAYYLYMDHKDNFPKKRLYRQKLK